MRLKLIFTQSRKDQRGGDTSQFKFKPPVKYHFVPKRFTMFIGTFFSFLIVDPWSFHYFGLIRIIPQLDYACLITTLIFTKFPCRGQRFCNFCTVFFKKHYRCNFRHGCIFTLRFTISLLHKSSTSQFYVRIPSYSAIPNIIYIFSFN